MDSKPIYRPFFYIIRNTLTGKMYAGSRTNHKWGVPAHPDQLLVTYFTSSTTVTKLIKSGVPFEIVRIKEFRTPEKALAFESRFLRLYNCVKHNQWYNRHDGKNLSPFHSEKFISLLQEKYGGGITNSMMIPGVAEKVSENLKGGINAWDEELQTVRRISIEEYKTFPDRYWHIQSKRYREKYKQNKTLSKPNVQTLFNIYDDKNTLIHQHVGKLLEFCKQNKLPGSTLQKSAYNGGERIFWPARRFRRASPEFARYRGWYAVIVQRDDQNTSHLPIEPI